MILGGNEIIHVDAALVLENEEFVGYVRTTRDVCS
jgi:hypothetical protein